MPDIPRQSVEIRDFPGLIENLDPQDQPSGAAIAQINCACIVPGELSTRGGYRHVSFES